MVTCAIISPLIVQIVEVGQLEEVVGQVAAHVSRSGKNLFDVRNF